MTLAIGQGQCAGDIALQVTESHSSPGISAAYMAGAVEIELDPETGHVEILDYYAVVDCGTVINRSCEGCRRKAESCKESA